MAMQQQVCRYYIQDKCTRGRNCKFYHPPKNQLQSSLRGQSAATNFDNGRNWDRREGNQFMFSRGEGYGGQRGGGRGGWQNGGRGNWQNSGRGGWQDGGRGSWQNSGRGNWQNSGRGNSWQNSGRGGWQNSGRGGWDNSGRGDWQNSGRGNWQNNGRGGWQNSGRGGWQNSGRGNWQNNGRGGWQNSGRGGWDNSGRGNSWENDGRGGGNNSSWLFGGGWQSDENMEIDDAISLNTSEIVQIIRRDMKDFESNRLWPLSSYTPVPLVCCNLPELQDYSMEEIRHLAYSASPQLDLYLGTLKPALEKQQFLWQWYQLVTDSDASQLMTSYSSTSSSSSLLSGTPVAGSNPFFAPVKDLFDVKGSKQDSPLPTSQESSTSDQEIKLTQSELEIYKSEKFTFGNIPETPPPSHLC